MELKESTHHRRPVTDRRSREQIVLQLDSPLADFVSAVSKLAHHTDVYLSSLRSYIEAMGGQLEIRALFPDAEVVITQFSDIVAE